MVDYVRRWGAKKDWLSTVDGVLNIVVHVPPTPGFEHVPVLTLQCHSDMVTLPDDDLDAPIEIEVADGWLQTKGQYRTLGADNGAGLALIMNAATSIKQRGGLKLLVTADEEDDFTGATKFDPEFHKMERGGLLVNVDTPYDRKVNISHAGFRYILSSMMLKRKKKTGFARITLKLDNLPGGHSGEDVHRFCGNAIRTMALLISRLPAGSTIVSIKGGDKGNNIPKACTATVQLPTTTASHFGNFPELQEIVSDLRVALRCPGITFSIETDETDVETLTPECHKELMRVLLGLPNGVLQMSADLHDLPLLSSTPSLVWEEGGKLNMKQLIRGANDDEMDRLVDTCLMLYRDSGFEAKRDSKAMAWNQSAKHTLVSATLRAFEETGYPALLGGNHGALELGTLFGDAKNPVFSAGVSFGPQIVDEHKKSERMNLASFARADNALHALIEGVAKGWLVCK
jgi:dipeptidase D